MSTADFLARRVALLESCSLVKLPWSSCCKLSDFGSDFGSGESLSRKKHGMGHRSGEAPNSVPHYPTLWHYVSGQDARSILARRWATTSVCTISERPLLMLFTSCLTWQLRDRPSSTQKAKKTDHHWPPHKLHRSSKTQTMKVLHLLERNHLQEAGMPWIWCCASLIYVWLWLLSHHAAKNPSSCERAHVRQDLHVQNVGWLHIFPAAVISSFHTENLTKAYCVLLFGCIWLWKGRGLRSSGHGPGLLVPHIA